jgi:hypothetical protein
MLENKSEIEVAAEKFRYLASGAPLSNVLFGYPSQQRLWFLAARALREASKREKGCEYCKSEAVISYVYHPTETDFGVQYEARYCPNCGQKLTRGVK